MNLVGFEHAASTDADKAAVAKARAQLENRWSCSPCQSPPAARWPARNCGVRCSATRRRPTHKEKAGHEHEHGHADIHAHYQLSCEKPELLKLLTLAEFFALPATQKIQVQLIGPDGQKGADLAPASAELKL